RQNDNATKRFSRPARGPCPKRKIHLLRRRQLQPKRRPFPGAESVGIPPRCGDNRARMNPLRIWCLFAAAVLLISAAVHCSTFMSIDPMQAIPGVMFIHVLIFPPFFAAIYYARK